ncbi:MAG: response regulator transcription factor [Planctomycetes bacterium]|nr:response regulator transcription factor [Planctomycetota bacterium]
MNILLVEDEDGIRLGLATFLQRRGHRVLAAADLGTAHGLLAAESVDLLVSDWHVGAGRADGLVRSARCPVFVVSGYPEEVEADPAKVTVLAKPVLPHDLLERIEALAAATIDAVPAAVAAARPAACWDDLPADARGVIEQVLALARAGGRAGIAQDGNLLVVEGPWASTNERDVELAAAMGGDFRVVRRAEGLAFVLRLFRDGRPDAADVVVALGQPWPGPGAGLAVDCDRAELARLDEFLAAVAAARERAAAGETVAFLNVPAAWRLCLETSGTGLAMPKREVPGPRLPAFLNELWSA